MAEAIDSTMDKLCFLAHRRFGRAYFLGKNVI